MKKASDKRAQSTNSQVVIDRVAELSVQNLVKDYGAVRALDGLSFEVEKGEFYCLLGPSSAGKTTTLRAIAGLEQLQGGTVEFSGQDVTTAAVQGRGMAMIFQTFALYPHLTVRQNFAYPLDRVGLARKDVRNRVEEIAELLRISHTLDRKPDTLSGGEQQRVAIGRALVRHPKLLLLDEPLTNLDAKLRHDTRAEFKRLHRELGMTMLYATPDQLEGLTMGQRIGVIRDGRITQIDTPRNLYLGPKDTFVATLVGAPAMNLVSGRARLDDGKTTIDLPFGNFASPAKASVDHGTEVLMGVRPHDIRLSETPGQGLLASVHLSEPLGDVTILDLRVKDTPLKMILPEERAVAIPVGSEIEVAVDPKDLHLFYQETGVRIA